MSMWTPTDDGHADIVSHDTYTQGVPHNTFARLRRDDPVHWTEWDGGAPFWSITRNADITAMNGNPRVFSSAQGIRIEDQTREEYLARRTFQETDAPEHLQTRMKVFKAFAKTSVANFAQDITDLTGPILDRALAQGTFNATREIARELPMRMLGRIMGLPESDLEWLVEKGDALMANSDPDFTDHVVDKLTTDEFRLMPFNSPAGAELYAYAKDLMDHKARMGDTDGILHMILKPAKDGTVISEDEFRNFFCLLVAAGNDTTRYSIAAGVHAIAEKPELLHQMQTQDVWDTMADEIIRWATPATYFRRTCTEDTEVHGKTIRAGDKVVYWWTSANRDPDAIPDPFHIDLTRTQNQHLAFGQHGPHVCLGMHLARLEVRILFQELSRRLKSIEPAGDVQYLRSNFVGGIKHLPVTVQL
ncbi:cytochrome P450 [Pseudooctadecabacter jejudonensis]|uniref:Putative cytochrome P450 124 n=1 Tax=Pseudooctadecabacter jejudonensis TaxID=1391910 RepID=A0A1Y5RAK4_9RHOB|nr:cytochrome P450 [Pseudooctadecabacter jejudonensis]SLN10241.1 Putative cytochrome P450 124 [Pseudooctadecabacter jejudonensis]